MQSGIVCLFIYFSSYVIDLCQQWIVELRHNQSTSGLCCSFDRSTTVFTVLSILVDLNFIVYTLFSAFTLQAHETINEYGYDIALDGFTHSHG